MPEPLVLLGLTLLPSRPASVKALSSDTSDRVDDDAKTTNGAVLACFSLAASKPEPVLHSLVGGGGPCTPRSAWSLPGSCPS